MNFHVFNSFGPFLGHFLDILRVLYSSIFLELLQIESTGRLCLDSKLLSDTFSDREEFLVFSWFWLIFGPY